MMEMARAGSAGAAGARDAAWGWLYYVGSVGGHEVWAW